MREFIDLTGQSFGRLTAIQIVESGDRGKSRWLCKCECGKEKTVRADGLRSGKSTSCGCYHTEINKTHGMSNTKMYRSWYNMKLRCYEPTARHYQDYGGRGIVVCDEWLNDFLKFFNWAIRNGYREDLTIDRIYVNGNYEPNNYRWSNLKEQANNKRTNVTITIDGETRTLKQWSEKYNINYQTLWYRINKRNLSPLEALMQPVVGGG